MSDFHESGAIEFNPEKQSALTDVATDICDKMIWQGSGKIPRIPWLSQNGQEEVFYKVSDMIIEDIINDPRLSYDENARSGVYFWSLSLIAANHKKFRVAIAAAKRTGPRFYEAGAFLQWWGTETHPSLAFAANAALWSKMREDGTFKAGHWTTRELKEKIA